MRGTELRAVPVVLAVLAGALVVLAGCGFTGLAPGDDGGDPVDGAPGVVDAAVDAFVDLSPDATQPVVCPGNYDFNFGASKYRLSGFSVATWGSAEADCEDDTLGRWTHLVAIDDLPEWSWLADGLRNLPGSFWFHIGVVRDAGSPGGPWRSVTGGTAFTRWRQTPTGNEPNNGGAGEPVVAMDTADIVANDPDYGGYLDVEVGLVTFYVCECDGLPPVNAAP